MINSLIKDLHDDTKDKRKEAMGKLVECGNPALIPLIDLLYDESWIIRYRAAEALGLIGDDRSIGPLTRCLKDEKDHVRYMAAKSLGFMKQPVSSFSLIPLLKDENEYVRKIAAISMGNIGGSRAVTAALEEAAEKESITETKDAMKTALNQIFNR